MSKRSLTAINGWLAHALRDPVVQDRAFRWIACPFLVLFALLGLPVVGTLVGIGLIELASCEDGSGGALRGCMLLGQDVSDVLYGYGIGIFLAGAINPLLFFQLLDIYLPAFVVGVWTVVALTLAVVKWRAWRKRRRAVSSAHGKAA